MNSVCSGLQGTARIFLLTKKSVVLADQKTGQVKASVPLPDLASVSVSTQKDGFFALRLKEVRWRPVVVCSVSAVMIHFLSALFNALLLQT